MKDIYDLKLHEYTNPDETSKITRVPGGWIYESILIGFGMNSVFVPWHDSGRMIESNGGNDELKARLEEVVVTLGKEKSRSEELAEKLQRAEDFLYRIQVHLGLTPPDLKTIKHILSKYGDK